MKLALFWLSGFYLYMINELAIPSMIELIVLVNYLAT